jgi:hypothetical protein
MLVKLGDHYDVNIFRKKVAEAWDNTDYDLAFDNISHDNSWSRDDRGIYRTGSPWLMNKIHVHKSPSEVVESWWGNFPIYHGCFTAPVPITPSPFSLSDLEGYGPEMWDRMKPDRPLMPLANAFYELKDLPGMLKQRFEFNNLKDIADFNLGVSFGWLPLLSDIRNFVQKHRGLQKSLAHLLRNNGRPVRRRIPLDNNHSEDDYDVLDTHTESPPGFSNPTLVSQGYGSEFSITTSSRFKKRIWAAGQFRYWLPDQGSLTDSQYQTMLIRRLFGLTPTPLYIYRAMPWSWLLDWFSNVGNNISNMNLQVVERLICDYAFVMRSVELAAECHVSGPIHIGQGRYQTVTATTTNSRIVKERVGASPFGFQIDEGSLSPFQLSILASLGAQRR